MYLIIINHHIIQIIVIYHQNIWKVQKRVNLLEVGQDEKVEMRIKMMKKWNNWIKI